jgi:hypothetical protein
MSGKPGIFTRKAGFLIDDHGLKRIDFRLTGRVVDTENTSSAEPQTTGPTKRRPWPDGVYGEASRTCQLDLRGQPCSIKIACLIPISARQGAFR